MSGHHIYIDDAIQRREFIKRLCLAAGLPLVASAIACNAKKDGSHITGSIVGANHQVGHLLRNHVQLPAPSAVVKTNVLVVGGGISGLSAMRWLQKQGVQDVMMTEMDTRVGGNAVYGTNKVSSYPWAAHYLPVPDVENKELLAFLQEAGVITGYNAEGLPVYNEYHLCHDPEERLYINGYWQEGLVPHFSVPQVDKDQIGKFFHLVEELKHKKGSDGKDWFAIPIDRSSADEECRVLDRISFDKYLAQQGFTSPYLLWYLDYSCKDDYGVLLSQVSAWAGLHYFASRKGRAANATGSDVLTWPEGNGYLMNALHKQCGNTVKLNGLVYKVDINENGAIAHCYDTQTKQTTQIEAAKILMCTPQYVNKHILSSALIEQRQDVSGLNYSLWMVANITFSKMPKGKGASLSWDNVIYGKKSVGYVFANHQNLNTPHEGVLTFYLPITGNSAKETRQLVYTKDYNYWKAQVLEEMEYAHPGITEHISNIDVWVWGHGMISPQTGYIWGAERQALQQPIDNKVFFAHTDLSGISIFEEAFYQGIKAADAILKSI